METVIIKTFNNYFSANIYFTKMQSSGIECYLKDEYTITIDPLLSNAIGGIKLIVKKEDAEEALQLIKQFDEDYIKSAQCPQCGAKDFTYIAKPGAGNMLTSIITWVVSSYAVAPVYVYHCGKCGYETESLPDSPIEEETE